MFVFCGYFKIKLRMVPIEDVELLTFANGSAPVLMYCARGGGERARESERERKGERQGERARERKRERLSVGVCTWWKICMCEFVCVRACVRVRVCVRARVLVCGCGCVCVGARVQFSVDPLLH